jgi:hypothetical protein
MFGYNQKMGVDIGSYEEVSAVDVRVGDTIGVKYIDRYAPLVVIRPVEGPIQVVDDSNYTVWCDYRRRRIAAGLLSDDVVRRYKSV